MSDKATVGRFDVFDVERAMVHDGGGGARGHVHTFLCPDWCNVIALTENEEDRDESGQERPGSRHAGRPTEVRGRRMAPHETRFAAAGLAACAVKGTTVRICGVHPPAFCVSRPYRWRMNHRSRDLG